MSRCRFTASARQDLKEIAAYIRRDNPAAARRVVLGIREVCQTTLAMFPGGGSLRDDLAPELRCFTAGNYVVFFRGKNPVEIIRIVHGARNITPEMF